MYKELFVEYHKLKNEVKRISNELDDLLDKKAECFRITQPKVNDPSKELVTSTFSNSDKFLVYVEKTAELDKEITAKNNELGIKRYKMKLKLAELRESKYILDRIYVYKYVDNLKVGRFYRLLDYSRKQVYRKLEEIHEKLKDDTK